MSHSFLPRPKTGGRKPGAGRPKGSKTSEEIKTRAALKKAARSTSNEAINTLIDLMNGKHFVRKWNPETRRTFKEPQPVPASVRKGAAEALLDRGYGKAAQEIKRPDDEDKPAGVDFTRLSHDEFVQLYRLQCKLENVEPDPDVLALANGSAPTPGNGAAGGNGSVH